MKPAVIKSIGYLISTLSVVLLGIAAWPGARDAHLLPLLVAGMAASCLGMACRWRSYQIEERGKAAAPSRSTWADAASADSSPASRSGSSTRSTPPAPMTQGRLR